MLPASATPSRPYLLKHSVQHWNCLLQTMHSQLKLQQLHRQFCKICDFELLKSWVWQLYLWACFTNPEVHFLCLRPWIWHTENVAFELFNIERRWLIYTMFEKLVGWILRFFSPAVSNLVPPRGGPPSRQGACSCCSAVSTILMLNWTSPVVTFLMLLC